MDDYLREFRGLDYRVSDKLSVRQPTLDDICTFGETEYFGLVQLICSTPADRKLEIWESRHIYWDEVNEYELFLSIFDAIKKRDVSILFGDIDFQSFRLSRQTGNLFAKNGSVDMDISSFAMVNKDGVVIDRASHKLITDYLRRLHRMEKNCEYGANKRAKNDMIEDARIDAMLAAKKPKKSQLTPLISAMTNCSEFKYRWDDVWSLPVGVFMDAVSRVQKLKHYGFLMGGIYGGNVDIKKINKKELDWMGEIEISPK